MIRLLGTRNLAPCLSGFDQADVTLRHAEVRGNLLMGASVLEDQSNGFGGHFGKVMLRPTLGYSPHGRLMHLSRNAPTSTKPVIRIVLSVTPPEVIRTHARRIVAGVKRILVCCGRAPIDQQRQPMRRNRHRLLVNLYRHTAIAAPVAASLPDPAIAGSIYLRPKALFEAVRNFGYKANSHGAGPSRGGQGRALLTQRYRPVLHTLCAPLLQVNEAVV